MINKVGTGAIDLAKLQEDLKSINGRLELPSTKPEGTCSGFVEMLGKGIAEVNSAIKEGDKASMDLVSGKSTNIHQTMLTVAKAEIGFNMLVQLRNKAIESYQEVMRMQV